MNALPLLVLLVSGASARPPKVSLRPEGGAYHVVGEFKVNAVPSVAWSVVTDYDGISGFVSTIRSSRVVSRGPSGLVVEQEGEASFLFASRTIKIRLLVQEAPPDRVYFEEVGDRPFALYEGHWSIVPDGSGSSVTYELDVDPDPDGVPRFIASHALRTNISRQLDQVRAEIERRAGAH